MEAAFGFRTRPQRRENCPRSAAANLQTDKRSHPEKQESQEEGQEVRVDGEDGSGQKRGKSEHGHEDGVAIRHGAVEPQDGDEQQKVDGGEQRGVDRGIARTLGKRARIKQQVQRNDEDIGENKSRGRALLQFRRVAAPPPHALVENRQRCSNAAEGIELARGGKRQNAREHKEKEGRAIETIGRERTAGGCDGRSHGATLRIASGRRAPGDGKREGYREQQRDNNVQIAEIRYQRPGSKREESSFNALGGRCRRGLFCELSWRWERRKDQKAPGLLPRRSAEASSASCGKAGA